MMLAQIENVPSESIKNAALIILAILGALYYAKETFFKSGKRDVQLKEPLSVLIFEELHKQFAAKNEFDNHVAENNRQHELFRGDLKTERDQSQIHISTRQKTLFDEIKSTRASLEKKLDDKQAENSVRLNSVEKSIGGLEATSDLQNQKLAQLELKVDNLPGKVLELLDRTGQLKK